MKLQRSIIVASFLCVVTVIGAGVVTSAEIHPLPAEVGAHGLMFVAELALVQAILAGIAEQAASIGLRSLGGDVTVLAPVIAKVTLQKIKP